MSTTLTQHYVDGNAMAGDLLELFGTDVTDAVGTCSFCGHRAAIGEARAYTRGPGVVLRCTQCENVLVRWAITPEAVLLEMPGLRRLRITGRT